VSAIHILQHPLASHVVTQLRDRTTPSHEFRRLLRILTSLLMTEATRDLRLTDREIMTPLAKMTGQNLADRVGLIPILRAGLGMVETALEFLPQSEVWHLGLYRDEVTAEPVEYYRKFPQSNPVDLGIVLDPMLATGGSATAALSTLRRWGVPRTKLLAVIASQTGIEVVQRGFPQVQLFVGAVDAELNAENFIVPGLGDAGDRIFRTGPASHGHLPSQSNPTDRV